MTYSIPDVPMAMLTSLSLDEGHWRQIAANASWQTLRMNLNTFQRHGVFRDAALVRVLAEKLRDAKQIERAKPFPYQLLVAYQNATGAPAPIREALQDALEIATGNVPAIEGQVWVLVDVSGSMHGPVTGHRKGATTAVRCVDVAALIVACIMRRNPTARILPFSDEVQVSKINPRDSVMTNASRLASLPAGGTNCSAPLRWLNTRRERGDLVIFVSDNESWMDNRRGGRSTATLAEWQAFKARNPGARLVCIDLTPNGTTQAHDREDVLNIGGFSDAVFEFVADFARQGANPQRWVDVIEAIEV